MQQTSLLSLLAIAAEINPLSCEDALCKHKTLPLRGKKTLNHSWIWDQTQTSDLNKKTINR